MIGKGNGGKAVARLGRIAIAIALSACHEGSDSTGEANSGIDAVVKTCVATCHKHATASCTVSANAHCVASVYATCSTQSQKDCSVTVTAECASSAQKAVEAECGDAAISETTSSDATSASPPEGVRAVPHVDSLLGADAPEGSDPVTRDLSLSRSVGRCPTAEQLKCSLDVYAAAFAHCHSVATGSCQVDAYAACTAAGSSKCSSDKQASCTADAEADCTAECTPE